MKFITRLMNYQKERCNPGQRLGEFLLQHSNHLPYLVNQLEWYLEAAKMDLEDQQAFEKEYLSEKKEAE